MDGLAPLLDAIIAVVATLYGFSLLVTLLIELITRVFALDARRMGAFLDRFAGKLVAQTKISEDEAKSLMTLAKEQPIQNWWVKWLGKLLPSAWAAKLKNVEKLDFDGFLDRARESPNWQALNAKFTAAFGDSLTGLKESYNQLWLQARDVFGRNTRVLALVIGVGVAAVGNVNIVTLYNFYLDNPAIAEAMVDDVAKLESATNAILAQPACDPTETDCSAKTSDFAKSVQDTVANFNATLQKANIPIGWEGGKNFFSLFAVPDDCVGKGCAVEISSILALIITGLFIGIGSPHLHDLLEGLIALRGKRQTGKQ